MAKWDKNRTQPGKHNPQQNKSSYTAGKEAGMMRLICKIKENNRRGISNHDRRLSKRAVMKEKRDLTGVVPIEESSTKET